MAFFQNYKFKASGTTLTAVTDFTNAAVGTLFEKDTGEVYEKTADGSFPRLLQQIPSTADLTAAVDTRLPKGAYTINMATSAVVLTPTQFDNNSFEVTGVLTADSTITIPDNVQSSFIIKNNTTGNFLLRIKHAANAGITIGSLTTVLMYSNGTVLSEIQSSGGGVGVINKFHAAGDGVKTVFSIADFVEPGFIYKTGASAVDVWIDGVLQFAGAFTETNATTITFSAPPALPAVGVVSNIEVRTVSSYSTSGNKISEYRFIGDGVKTLFSAADMHVPGFAYTVGDNSLIVDVGGVAQNTADYTETQSTQITFNVAPPVGVVGVVKVIGSVILADAIPLSETKSLKPNWKNIIANTTAVSRDGLFVDTLLKPITVTLPASVGSAVGDYVKIHDVKGNFGINNCIVASDVTLMGIVSPMILSTNNLTVELVFTGTDWRIV